MQNITMQNITIKSLLALAVLLLTIDTGSAATEGKPLRVYILAGQSNMEGHAKVETFDYIGDDPNTALVAQADATTRWQARGVRASVDLVPDWLARPGDAGRRGRQVDGGLWISTQPDRRRRQDRPGVDVRSYDGKSV